MNRNVLFILIGIFIFAGIAESQNGFLVTDSSLYNRAVKISKELILLDSHVDLPLWLQDEWFDVSQYSEKGEIDYARAMDGGLDIAFMAVYTSPNLEGTGRAKQLADSLIDVVYKMEREWPDKFKIIRSPADIEKELNKGRLLLPMGLENGSPIENSMENLGKFYKRGIRYVTLSHVKRNHISDSSNDPDRKWNGLSPFGEEVIKEMNHLGMMIDVSHISDSAFYDVIKLSKAPVIASHSSCRFFVPENERNMSDEMIKTLAENKGVIQINFAGLYLVNEIFNQYKELSKAETERRKYFKDNNIIPGSEEAKEYTRKMKNENPISKATVADVADHIDHVVKLVGVDYVGIGSDFNGIGESIPVGLEDVSKYPNLIYELLKRGYTDDQIKKIFGGNFIRVWKEVESVSGSLR